MVSILCDSPFKHHIFPVGPSFQALFLFLIVLLLSLASPRSHKKGTSNLLNILHFQVKRRMVKKMLLNDHGYFHNHGHVDNENKTTLQNGKKFN